MAFIRIVTGSGPQSKVMIPPAATARTTASEVQLAGVPVPTVLVGREVSTARASAGTVAPPFGLPARSGEPAVFDGFGDALLPGPPRPLRAGGPPDGLTVGAVASTVDRATGAAPSPLPPQAGRVAVATPRASRQTRDLTRTRRC
ncbi:hypothetical protein GCM10027259_53020 [Micromonospora palomenae]